MAKNFQAGDIVREKMYSKTYFMILEEPHPGQNAYTGGTVYTVMNLNTSGKISQFFVGSFDNAMEKV